MKFELTILGSSSAVPTSDRYPTSQVLNVQERFFLIDCGEGTQIQLRRNKFRFSKINHIFISHLHGDHYYGLFGVIATMGLLGRKNDLHIYGPAKLKDILDFHTNILEEKADFEIVFHPTNKNKQETIFEDKIITIDSFPLKHRIPTCGFLFREKQRPLNMKKDVIEYYNIPVKEIYNIKMGADFVNEEGDIISNTKLTEKPVTPRAFAFCSDTAYTESILSSINNIDLLYHEATFMHNLKEQATKSQHSTCTEAATIASKAKVGKLIIGHYSTRYRNLKPLLDEARSVFPNTELATENKTFSVESNPQ